MDPEAPVKTRKGGVKPEKSRDSAKVRDIEHGEVVRGTAEDGWIRLEDGTGFALMEHPKVGTLMKEERVTSWRYADPCAPEKTRSVSMYSAKTRDASAKVGSVQHGAVLRGIPEGNWLRLEDGSGFIGIVHESLGTLLVEQAAELSDSSDSTLEQRLITIFEQFDADANGKMDIDEMGKLLKILNPECTTDDVEKMVKAADANKDGVLDIKEFSHWICTGQTVKDVEKMKGAFKMLSIREILEGEERKAVEDGEVPDSIKEKFQGLWDEARKLRTDSPDDFVDMEQFIEFVVAYTHGAVEFDNTCHSVMDARNFIVLEWRATFGSASGYGKIKAEKSDKAKEAARRRGLLYKFGEPKEDELLDLVSFIRWLDLLASDAVYPDSCKDLIEVVWSAEHDTKLTDPGLGLEEWEKYCNPNGPG